MGVKNPVAMSLKGQSLKRFAPHGNGNKLEHYVHFSAYYGDNRRVSYS
jgi:hypothetical protein